MDILVLLKQVPATESLITIADDGKRVNTDNAKWVINPYDEFAVEEALQIKKAHGGTVTVISVGNDKTVEALRTGLAMGADRAVLINDPATADCDGLGIARILAAAIRDMSCDVIIAGQRAVDDDNYLVGAAVAEFLNIPHISMVVKEEITDGTIRCHQSIDGGTSLLEAPLPVLFTTQRGLNEPRYASLPGIMKAKKKPIDTRTLADIGLDAGEIAPRARIIEMKLPPERTGGRIIEGDSAQAKAAALVRALREEAKVI
ncbi:electron transfer flavoprotein subunit beta [Desulfonema ishimotonii]|uniref:Electron transfer flavoprotein subunit beta n=1 Tax=Desulfonema ishimotonii TaxID=45657 RepID=A0A401G187_9BACT|nr:electron transfer flavoprotein subunit beta/FixA family protein [Desulfonema ishimotonii]GBC62974.1 electron transfer flavoprotein subunit beta [Desulfonema ishimotonii]